MEYMRSLPDGFFDLAIVDPPYGIGIMKQWGNSENGFRKYDKKEWDSAIPSQEYFTELFRVSKNQIIWGGNYFTNHLPPSQCWVIWDKCQREFSMSDAEMAWVSFDKTVRIFSYSRGAHTAVKSGIHINEKPVALYKWLLTNYANTGDKIFDSHGGSFSSAIAAWEKGFDYTGIELDADYYNSALKRFQTHISQLKLL